MMIPKTIFLLHNGQDSLFLLLNWVDLTNIKDKSRLLAIQYQVMGPLWL